MMMSGPSALSECRVAHSFDIELKCEVPMPRMTVELPTDINDLITRIASEQGIAKTEVVRRAFAILKVAEEEKANGGMLGMVRKASDGKLEAVARIIGI
jgi:hypothetical protein